MILQFKVKNFLSIREEQTLDFTASADKTYEDYAVVKISKTPPNKHIGIPTPVAEEGIFDFSVTKTRRNSFF